MKTLLFLSYFLFLSCTFVQAQLDSGLVAWYPFSGSANDFSGHNFDGNIVSASLTYDRFGNANSAYSFDGNGDYIWVADHPLLRLGGSDFTISVWVNMEEFTNVTNTVVSKRSGIGNLGYFFQIIGDTHPFGIPPGTLNFITSGGQDPSLDSESPVPMGEWSNLVICFDWINQTGKLYLNTMLEKEGFLNIPNPNETVPLYIGWDGGFTGNFYFNGAMDDIRIYDRQLCLEEIDDLYNEGISPVNEPRKEARFALLPNPATDRLQLKVENIQPEQLVILDQLGRVVKKLKFQTSINISDLPSGMYYLRLEDRDGKKFGSEKFVKISP